MYVVRFVRKDVEPDEEYVYHTMEEAAWHLNQFTDDDSGLYKYIEIVDFNSNERVYKSIEFMNEVTNMSNIRSAKQAFV